MIQALGTDTPQMGPDVFIHEAAVVIGRVALGARASVPRVRRAVMAPRSDESRRVTFRKS